MNHHCCNSGEDRMVGSSIILIIFIFLILVGFGEAYLHKRSLAMIRIRIHVNGTRGKSSVVRLIAGGLREGGIVTCAKTTGTLARMILPDATEYPIFRPAGANVIEQVRIVAVAASYGADAIVVECMALQPQLQWLSESRFIQATHGVITNARADHLEVMGPEEKDVALALAGSTPVGAKLFTAERKYLAFLSDAARDRQTELCSVTPEDIAAIKNEEMKKFSYVEHEENVALALRVCRDLGVDREIALKGMWKAPPDPGVMTLSHISFFGRQIYFVNGFAANDPESSGRLWNMALERFPDVEKKIMIFNCRSDRPNRSEQLGKAAAGWRPADHYLLMGSGTYFLARSAISSGLSEKKIILSDSAGNSDIFETITELAGKSAVVVGMGNAKGQGLSLARFFRNRSTLNDTAQRESQ
jgi:gamma-polyglutamate synthase